VHGKNEQWIPYKFITEYLEKVEVKKESKLVLMTGADHEMDMWMHIVLRELDNLINL